MKRRKFIKMITTLTGVAFVPVSLLEAFEGKNWDTKPLLWYSENVDWIIENIVKNRVLNKEVKEAQTFRDTYTITQDEKISNNIKLRKGKQYLHNIAWEVVFSKKNERSMSGFLEQKGRLPTQKDKLVFEYRYFIQIIQRHHYEPMYYTVGKLK